MGGGGKSYTPPKPPVQEQPVQETGETEAERKARDEARRRAQKAAAGQRSTILTGGLGTNTGTAGTGSILGSGG